MRWRAMAQLLVDLGEQILVALDFFGSAGQPRTSRLRADRFLRSHAAKYTAPLQRLINGSNRRAKRPHFSKDFTPSDSSTPLLTSTVQGRIILMMSATLSARSPPAITSELRTAEC